MHNNHISIITLDGPSGTGKGTISQMLASRLNWHYLDSGALYRVLAYAAQKKGIHLEDVMSLVELAHQLDLHFEPDAEKSSQVFLSGQNISQDIRTELCSQNASKIAAIPEVREALLARQRAFARLPGLVTDGRDMGTVVFPEADLKIYLDASPEERASRRYLQLKKSGNNARLAQVIDELAKRDERDMVRKSAPLKPAPDAIKVDTTSLTIDQVFNHVLQLVDGYLRNG